MRRICLFACLLGVHACHPSTTAPRGPIIDVHLHATVIPSGADPRWFPDWLTPASSNDVLRQMTLAAMREYNVVRGIVNDYPRLMPLAQQYRADDPNRVIVGVQWGDTADSIEPVAGWLADNSVQVIGEITSQYAGLAPTDPLLEPIWRMAEQFDVPVGIHVGPSAPGSA